MSQPYQQAAVRLGRQVLGREGVRRAAFTSRNFHSCSVRRAKDDEPEGASSIPQSRTKTAFTALQLLHRQNAERLAERARKDPENGDAPRATPPSAASRQNAQRAGPRETPRREEKKADGMTSVAPMEEADWAKLTDEEKKLKLALGDEYESFAELEKEVQEQSDDTGFSNHMMKHLLDEHYEKKGNKPYSPPELSRDELLYLTQDMLPPLPGADPVATVQRFVEGTVQNWNPSGRITFLNADKENAKRLLEGLPVKFFSDADRDAALELAASEALKGPRNRAHEKLKADGFNPSEKVTFKPISKAQKADTERRLFAGAYKLDSIEGETAQERIQHLAQAAVESNASYRLKNQGQFMNVVKGLTEDKPRGRAPKMGLT